MADDSAIAQRKRDHLEVAASGRADFAKSTLLEHVHLVHQALPELALDAIDLSTELLGKRLAAPLVITGMTGGTPEAAAVNRDLAVAAQAAGVALGVGSQRAMDEHPALGVTYQVRDVAPDVVLFGNVGAVQAVAMGPARVIALAQAIGADALAIHLNPGQELIQERGDRDFRGVLDMIARIVEAAPMPVLVKETGCGLSVQAARALVGAGVHTIDVAGAGGTSWVAVEAVRAAHGSAAQSLGEELWDWGVPTAVSVAACVRANLVTIASGGLRSGYDVARALALGARAGGMAAPMLRAQRAGGVDGVHAAIARIVDSIR
ncbi:MAG TPA: type 2 isopentenyl-diphosphate Delta-isomerase, partial [Kofleriaceae bacterium]|nr:type 2 isopentenyl-diphosphate Delta-isomerase [Kofleriaceae bacterium]